MSTVTSELYRANPGNRTLWSRELQVFEYDLHDRNDDVHPVGVFGPEISDRVPSKKGPTPAKRRKYSDRLVRQMKRRARLAGLPLRVWAHRNVADPFVADWMLRKGVSP